MPKRVPTASVIVIREGKRVSPPLNKGFNFTEAEIAQIKAIDPRALRKPINESTDEDSTGKGHKSDDADASTATSKAEPDGSKKPNAATGRAEERRVGQEGVRPCRYRWSAEH